MRNRRLRVALACLAAALAIGVLADALLRAPDEFSRSTLAMGTVVSAKIYAQTEPIELFDQLETRLNQLENQISWRVATSDISALNANHSIVCDDMLAELFTLCERVRLASDGAFDLSAGALTALWNIGSADARVPSASEIQAALARVDGAQLRLGGGTLSAAAGQQIDLGAVGKGLACDQLREILERARIEGAVVSVGGSVLLYGRRPGASRWTVAIRDPRGGEGDYMGTLSLEGGCVSTSGDYERVYVAPDGARYHHILDARTGYPAQSDLTSATVACESGLLSDALSTAAFILGARAGLELIERFGAQGVLIARDGTVYLSDGLRAAFELRAEGYALAEGAP